MSKFVSKAKGFTLIELLVVIAIIGVLASIAMTSFGSARAKARDAKRVSDMRQIQTALQLYYDSVGMFPGQLADLVPTYLPNAQAYADPSTGTYKYNAYVSPTWHTMTPPVDVAPAAQSGAGSCGTGVGLVNCQGYQVGADFEIGNSSVVTGMTGVANVNAASAVRALGTATAAAACSGAANPVTFCYAWRQN